MQLQMVEHNITAHTDDEPASADGARLCVEAIMTLAGESYAANCRRFDMVGVFTMQHLDALQMVLVDLVVARPALAGLADADKARLKQLWMNMMQLSATYFARGFQRGV